MANCSLAPLSLQRWLPERPSGGPAGNSAGPCAWFKHFQNLTFPFFAMDSNQKALVGFVVGLAAGAVAGLLLAPNSGQETRRKIADKTKDLSDDLSGQINTAISKLSDYVEKVQSEIKGVASSAVEKAKANVN